MVGILKRLSPETWTRFFRLAASTCSIMKGVNAMLYCIMFILGVLTGTGLIVLGYYMAIALKN